MLLALLLACSDPQAPTSMCWRARWRGYVEQDGRLFGPPEFSTGHHDPGDVAWQGMGEVLDALASQDIQVVVVPVPTRPSALEGFDNDAERQAYGATLDRISERAAVIDVLSLAREDPGFFFTHDHHMSPSGIAAVAVAVAERVDHSELAHPLPAASWSIREVDESRPAGSVLRALNGVCGGTLERPRFHRTETVREDPPDLLGDEPAPRVVLVGSSQSSRKFNLGGHLALELGTTVLTVPVDGGGVLGGLQHYTSSADWRSAPPSVLVWEFPVRSFGAPGAATRADPTDRAVWERLLAEIRQQ